MTDQPTLTCDNCGEPISDERVLSAAGTINGRRSYTPLDPDRARELQRLAVVQRKLNLQRKEAKNDTAT